MAPPSAPGARTWVGVLAGPARLRRDRRRIPPRSGKRSGRRLFSRYVSSNPAAGFLAAICAIVLAVGVYLAVATSRQQNAARMADGMRTALALQRLGGVLWKAESGHRGFLLTRDPRERDRFEDAERAIEAELGALSEAAT